MLGHCVELLVDLTLDAKEDQIYELYVHHRIDEAIETILVESYDLLLVSHPAAEPVTISTNLLVNIWFQKSYNSKQNT